ncbi:MAG TPA: 30S ribosomal protein S2, partial [Gaiellaceae bacterium]|nr:30S ribosomal protein S2 [Gaiellaceae bacterium]
ISDRVQRLHELRGLKQDSQLELLPAKERISMEAELEKLEANLGGIADMRRQPDAIFIVDLRKEQLAVREARRLGLPVIALVDTNCDPDEAEYVIPGNDDAIRACSLVTRVIAEGVQAGKQKVRPGEFRDGGQAAQPAPEAEQAAAPEAAQPVAAQAEPEAAQPAPDATQPEPPAQPQEEPPAAEEIAAAPEYEQLSKAESASETAAAEEVENR